MLKEDRDKLRERTYYNSNPYVRVPKDMLRGLLDQIDALEEYVSKLEARERNA